MRHRRRHLRAASSRWSPPCGRSPPAPGGPCARTAPPATSCRPTAGPARPSSPPRRTRRCAPGSRPSPAGPSTPSPCGPSLMEQADRVLVVEDARELPGDLRLARGMDVGSLIGVRLEHCSVRDEPGRADARGPVRELLRAAQLLDPRAGGGPEPGQHGERGRGQCAPARADRAQPGGGARAGDARPPDRPAEPPRLPGAAGPRGGPGPPARTAAVAGALRSGPLQAGQRHPRSPGRRRGAGGGRPAPVGRLAAGGRGGADRGRGVRLAPARGRRATRPTWPPSVRARPSRRARWASPAR